MSLCSRCKCCSAEFYEEEADYCAGRCCEMGHHHAEIPDDQTYNNDVCIDRPMPVTREQWQIMDLQRQRERSLQERDLVWEFIAQVLGDEIYPLPLALKAIREILAGLKRDQRVLMQQKEDRDARIKALSTHLVEVETELARLRALDAHPTMRKPRYIQEVP